MKATVIGVRQSKNKQGVNAFNLSVSKPYTQYEVDKAEKVLGFNTENFYTTIDCSTLKPGDNVNLEFEPGYEGKATLTGVHLAK